MGVMLAISFVSLIGFAVLAVDIGTMTLVKGQLQNAADAGALAGAQELINDDTTTAKSEAIEFAGMNDALIDGGSGKFNVMDSVKITPADITFPEPRRIRVTTHRTQDTGDPFHTYFMRVINPSGSFANMRASATAGFYWVCGGSCVKPWAPPDRWFDANSDGFFDADSGDYYDPITTGYTDADLGTQITLVLNNANDDFGQFWYFSIDYPPIDDGTPITGASEYESWICEECHDNSFTVDIGEHVQIEPGKMKGPNGSGLRCLIELDPNAVWDVGTGTVINSDYPKSPRIVKAALFDPSVGLLHIGGRDELVVIKIMVIFIEEQQGNDQITGRFMRLSDPGGTVCEDQSNPTFLYTTRLIE